MASLLATDIKQTYMYIHIEFIHDIQLENPYEAAFMQYLINCKVVSLSINCRSLRVWIKGWKCGVKTLHGTPELNSAKPYDTMMHIMHLPLHACCRSAMYYMCCEVNTATILIMHISICCACVALQGLAAASALQPLTVLCASNAPQK